MEILHGKKTYLIAIGLGIVATVNSLGWITPEQHQLLLALLGSGGLAALRAGVAKAGE